MRKMLWRLLGARAIGDVSSQTDFSKMGIGDLRNAASLLFKEMTEAGITPNDVFFGSPDGLEKDLLKADQRYDRMFTILTDQINELAQQREAAIELLPEEFRMHMRFLPDRWCSLVVLATDKLGPDWRTLLVKKKYATKTKLQNWESGQRYLVDDVLEQLRELPDYEPEPAPATAPTPVADDDEPLLGDNEIGVLDDEQIFARGRADLAFIKNKDDLAARRGIEFGRLVGAVLARWGSRKRKRGDMTQREFLKNGFGCGVTTCNRWNRAAVIYDDLEVPYAEVEAWCEANDFSIRAWGADLIIAKRRTFDAAHYVADDP